MTFNFDSPIIQVPILSAVVAITVAAINVWSAALAKKAEVRAQANKMVLDRKLAAIDAVLLQFKDYAADLFSRIDTLRGIINDLTTARNNSIYSYSPDYGERSPLDSAVARIQDQLIDFDRACLQHGDDITRWFTVDLTDHLFWISPPDMQETIKQLRLVNETYQNANSSLRKVVSHAIDASGYAIGADKDDLDHFYEALELVQEELRAVAYSGRFVEGIARDLPRLKELLFIGVVQGFRHAGANLAFRDRGLLAWITRRAKRLRSATSVRDRGTSS